jgi:hypothetical protein
MKEKLVNADPNSPEVRARVREFIRSMTPEEAYAFLTHRTPGIEETWTGPVPEPGMEEALPVSRERRIATRRMSGKRIIRRRPTDHPEK